LGRIRRVQELLIPTAECFEPLLAPARYKGARGGRGGAKSHFFAGKLVEDAWAEEGLLSVCLREVQKDLKHSSKSLIEAKLVESGLGEADGFKVFREAIETPGDGVIIFNGMQSYNAASIKSLEGFKRAWWEEAESAGSVSLDLLRPTLRPRTGGAELWFSWNPKDPPDKERPFASVDGMFTLNDRKQIPGYQKAWTVDLPSGGILVDCGWQDNPWFPEDLEAERRDALKRRTLEDYAHIWEGAYEVRSDRRVFHNWKVCEYETPVGATFRFGMDWGFSIDPAVCIRCFIGRWEGEPGASRVIADDSGRDLFIDYEAWRVGCDIDYTPALFAGPCPFPPSDARHWKNPYGDPGIPGALDWPAVADSSLPQNISYLKRHGFVRLEPSIKGPGSVQEGVEFLKAYSIWIHPRCKHVADEFLYYSFKVDPRTGNILPVLQDAKNHTIDSCRYAVERVRRARGFFG